MAPKSRTVAIPENPFRCAPLSGLDEENIWDEILRVLRQLLAAASRASRALLRVATARLRRQARGLVIIGGADDRVLTGILAELTGDVQQIAYDLELM